MGGDEDDGRPLAAIEHEPRDLEAGHAGHLDVEEDHVVTDVLGQRQRLGGRRRLADDLQLGVRGEQVAQLPARWGFVVDDQSTDSHAAGTSSRTTVPNPPDFSRTPAP